MNSIFTNVQNMLLQRNAIIIIDLLWKFTTVSAHSAPKEFTNRRFPRANLVLYLLQIIKHDKVKLNLQTQNTM